MRRRITGEAFPTRTQFTARIVFLPKPPTMGFFISRFGNDSLLYSQNRTGRSFGENLQLYWNWNATMDAKGEYWANTFETGPGVRFRINPVQFTVNLLRGAYLVNQSNPYRPNFNDIRIGVWYAFTH
jgi:hypothetical protein